MYALKVFYATMSEFLTDDVGVEIPRKVTTSFRDKVTTKS